MRRVFFGIVLILFWVSFQGCREKEVVSLRVYRFDEDLFGCRSEADVRALLARQPGVTQAYLGGMGTPDSMAANLYRLVTDSTLRGFYDQTQAVVRQAALAEGFGEAFAALRERYPNFREPRVVTAFTGFTADDLFVSDTLIVIGLDYFGGPQARFRPQVYDYQLRKYVPEAIVPQALLLLSAKYNETNLEDRTLLAEMVYYGKSYEFVKEIRPETPDSLLIGYTGEQLAATAAAQDLVWAHLIDNKLLYETSPLRKVKYVGERPGTPEIGPKAPGSIGRWVGWQIVRGYRENGPKESFPEFMKNTNAQRILEQSKYRGQVGEHE
jgi:hypothetical protein